MRFIPNASKADLTMLPGFALTCSCLIQKPLFLKYWCITVKMDFLFNNVYLNLLLHLIHEYVALILRALYTVI